MATYNNNNNIPMHVYTQQPGPQKPQPAVGMQFGSAAPPPPMPPGARKSIRIETLIYLKRMQSILFNSHIVTNSGNVDGKTPINPWVILSYS
jgi:hypothetical protein